MYAMYAWPAHGQTLHGTSRQEPSPKGVVADVPVLITAMQQMGTTSWQLVPLCRSARQAKWPATQPAKVKQHAWGLQPTTTGTLVKRRALLHTASSCALSIRSHPARPVMN